MVRLDESLQYADIFLNSDFVRSTAVPYVWFAPHGLAVVATDPQTVTITDRAGNQGGQNNWPGLHEEMGAINYTFFRDLRTAHHFCDLCQQDLVVEGETHSVSAAVLDGICKTSCYKCLFHGCRLDLPGMGGER